MAAVSRQLIRMMIVLAAMLSAVALLSPVAGATPPSSPAVAVTVRYQGAAEWYVVRGAGGRLRDPADGQVLHEVLVGVLDRPEG